MKINIFFLLCFIVYNQFEIWNFTYSLYNTDLSCKLTNLVYFTQAKCFIYTDRGFLELLSGPRHKTTRQSTGYVGGILRRGYKTSFHFRSLPMEIRLIISIETNSSLFLYHNCSLFVVVTISFPFISNSCLIFTSVY